MFAEAESYKRGVEGVPKVLGGLELLGATEHGRTHFSEKHQ